MQRLKRQSAGAISLVIPSNEPLRTMAKRYGFPVYLSIKEGTEASEHGAISTRSHHFTRTFSPERSAPDTTTPAPSPTTGKLAHGRDDEFPTPPHVAVPTHVTTQTKAGRVPFPLLRDGNMRRRTRTGSVVAGLCVVLLVVGIAAFPLFSMATHPTAISSARVDRNIPQSQPGIGVVQAPDGEMIGLSDGSYAFDTGQGRTDGTLKTRASEKLRAGDVGSALSLWHEATSSDSNDAEALIYAENQRVLSSGSPWVTVVVGTMATGTYVGLGRDDMQGAYVAQREYNSNFKLPGNVLVRLLVASTGNDKTYANGVAQQIVRAAQKDKTLVGVMGWPYSSRTLNVVKTLADAHLPLVSQMASSTLLTHISSYFFRIVPPDAVQAYVGAEYVEHTLHAKTAALFIDSTDAYSESVGSAFRHKFLADGNTLVDTEHYTAGKPETLSSQTHNALGHHPDIIYFAGVASDANTLLAALPTRGPSAKTLVMGGDGLYEIGSYSKEASVNFDRLRFSAFAYPDEWGFLGITKGVSPFFREYAQDFNPDNLHTSSVYGFIRADGDAILSYDAVVVVIEGCRLVLEKGGTSVSSTDVRQALTTINGQRTLQGASGQIAFGPDGNPINKAVIVLGVSTQGVHLESIQGQFLK